MVMGELFIRCNAIHSELFFLKYKQPANIIPRKCSNKGKRCYLLKKMKRYFFYPISFTTPTWYKSVFVLRIEKWRTSCFITNQVSQFKQKTMNLGISSFQMRYSFF
ncbi:hypothetical protein M0811_00623 [Anaeramoeba ignava]|uniref:Uncharacterized protein n=1 Tax=Anaeramoeba ignava TaxID=1746090 RepID=A0A9Q0LTT3_ANAIG|nr:hypothetical protein M0811_00623 [Anaeramoeba ignava]